jgi:hypothetical protein
LEQRLQWLHTFTETSHIIAPVLFFPPSRSDHQPDDLVTIADFEKHSGGITASKSAEVCPK